MFIHMYIYVYTPGFELSILQSHIAIYFFIINIPKKKSFYYFCDTKLCAKHTKNTCKFCLHC